MAQQGSAPRRSPPRRYRGNPRRVPGPAAQLLVDAALDVIGVICFLALARGLVGLAAEPAWMICLGVAGLDLVLRTSLRRAAVWLCTLPARAVKTLVAARRQSPATPAAVPQSTPLPEPTRVDC